MQKSLMPRYIDLGMMIGGAEYMEGIRACHCCAPPRVESVPFECYNTLLLWRYYKEALMQRYLKVVEQLAKEAQRGRSGSARPALIDPK
jgi:hypothetical protein